MASINRASPVPIYHQLKMLIQQRIKSGLWGPGDRIPTECELCQMYGISRSPVRQALNQLAQEGVLIRRPGLGTFVANHVLVDVSPEVSIRMMCSDPYWSTVLEHTSRVWNERDTEPKVTFEIDVVPHRRFYDLLSAAVGSGTAPDLAMVDSVWVAGLAKSGFLHALDGLDSPWNRSAFGDDLYPPLVDANSLEGRLYGLPVKADASLLWYRKDWFAKEGLTAPRDWDDLQNAVVHFLRSEVRERYSLAYPLVFPGGTAGGEATVYSLLPFIWSAGGEIIDADARRVILDSPETSRALRFLRELVHQHSASSPSVVDYQHDTSPKFFAEGKAAMALGGSYEAELIQAVSHWSDADFSHHVGAVPPPAPPGRNQVSTVGGTSYVILRQCEWPALVTDVLKVATDPDVIGNLYRSMWLNLPSPSFDAMLEPDTQSLLTQVSKMIVAGRARPSLPEYVKVSRQLQAMFEATISDSDPVEDIVQRTTEFISVITELPH
jgi:multiple sugar transport system substrate-binding protein